MRKQSAVMDEPSSPTPGEDQDQAAPPGTEWTDPKWQKFAERPLKDSVTRFVRSPLEARPLGTGAQAAALGVGCLVAAVSLFIVGSIASWLGLGFIPALGLAAIGLGASAAYATLHWLSRRQG